MSGEMAEIKRRLAVFSDRPLPVTDAEVRTERRERMVARMEEVLAEPRGFRWTWLRSPWFGASGGLALAATLALVLGHRATTDVAGNTRQSILRSLTLHGSVLCQHGAADAWVPCQAQALASGAILKTLDRSSAELESAAGVRLDLGSDAILALRAMEALRRESSVTLSRGLLDVRVPPLTDGARFSVVTPAATVIVHGTAFSVEVTEARDGRYRACVRVTEGTVSVRHPGGEQPVTALGTWGCDAAPDSARAVLGTRSPPSEASASQPESVTRASSATAPERSTLAVEAHLLQKALGAERRGDLASAERTLTSLLSAFPNSVVAPEARAALERIRRRQQELRP